MRNQRLLFLVFFLLITGRMWAMEIKGKIVMKEGWQPVVFLASLNSPSDLSVASPDFIIARSFIKADGSFEIITPDVPEEERFYRLYLVKGDNSLVEFNSASNRNFIHLLLSRNSDLELEAETDDNAFRVLSFGGDAAELNKKILDFDTEVSKMKSQLAGEITKARRDYLTNEQVVFIRNFVEGEENAMVGLYALYQIDGKDTDFLRHPDFYLNFQEKLENQYPGTSYTDAYADLLKDLIGFRDMVCEMPGVQPKWKDQLLVAQSVFILLLFSALIWLLVILRKYKSGLAKNSGRRNLIDGLTTKQQEILQMLADGKTNKEIAQELFVELSTVKTHINNIYRQLDVTSRQEAIGYLRTLNDE